MNAVQGQEAPHRPVLYQETIQYLTAKNAKRFLDCTAGAGGHSEGLLRESSPDSELIALDLDPTAIALSQERLKPFGNRAKVIKASYLEAPQVLQAQGWDGVDGILMDLGVSSMQFDQGERGFSFRFDAPLDMRFDPNKGQSASDLVNGLSESELAQIIWEYGEEKYSRRIAKAIVQARPLYSTFELAEIVRKAVGKTREQQDPATRTFQALRIAVNDELNVISQAVPNLIELLQTNGRIAIISFHSLEDRIVKNVFRQASTDCICPPEKLICDCGHVATVKVLTKRPITASEDELQTNPRSRSARLRIAQKL
ncbi:MAG: 16S rRNA (cytosine(1402)-N(4))-methyltransferase RsmH [Chloroflexi bacterium]|nr:16S rRNA (cytosine(1402)-N(4))-methyltransferase RsmH [Chloroflexota bacterium]